MFWAGFTWLLTSELAVDEVWSYIRSRNIDIHRLSYCQLGKEVSVYCTWLIYIHCVNKHIDMLRGKWG